jgi:tetratricopeptide (TPR) repeat protein
MKPFVREALFPLIIGWWGLAAFAGRPQTESHGVSVIVVNTQTQATELRAQLRSGASYEVLAMKFSLDPTAPHGGYVGVMGAANVPPEFRSVLEGMQSGAISSVTRIGERFALLKLATPAEDGWRSLDTAANDALRQGRFPEAESLFVSAVVKAKEFMPEDVRLADSLNGLARAYRYQGKYGNAESSARQALAIQEQALGTEHPAVLDSLVNLVASVQFQENYADAESLYRRILSLRWRTVNSGPAANVTEVLDDFATVLTLAYLGDGQVEEALGKFRQSIADAPLHKDLYLVLRDGLETVRFNAEAEALMQRAVAFHPDSRQLRFQWAELHVRSSRYQKALEIFEAASRLPSQSDPNIDRSQRSLSYTKIAEMNMFLTRFDDALIAVKTALNLDPRSVEARLTLANLYFLRNRLDEAAVEYRAAISAAPQTVAAYYGLAQTDLSRGHFVEAAATAARALEIDPGHQQSRYVRAMALIRSGRTEEAQMILQEYDRREADSEARELERQEVAVLDRDAAAKVVGGQLEEAVDLLRDGIRLHPAAQSLYLKQGLIQSKMGLHTEAIGTFRKMIELKIDDFLVHKNLSREYEILGDIPASRRHRVIYLQKYDAALKAKIDR